MPSWYFRPKQAGEPNREPIQGEFFASDAISDPGTALVREGIQNALDAGTKGGPAVLVRIFVSAADEAVSADPYLPASTWDHFEAAGNGLNQDGLPRPGSPCRFIAFEDFSTCGLEGDPAEAFRSREGRKNHFYHFFRAEGQTDKEASDRGSWGVGKHVFLRASQISTIFGLSVRASDQRHLLMGKSVLKSHWVGPDYCQDGYFGVRPLGEQGLVLAVEDPTVLNAFATLFGLQRGNSPGLSLVVPWPDEEITDRALIGAVVRDYFYPILNGQLEVVVETPTLKTVLDSSSLLPVVGALDPAVVGDLKPMIELAVWANAVAETERLVARPLDPNRAWQWSDDLLSAEQLTTLRRAYHSGEKLAVRIPLTVRKRDGSVQQSFFDVYLTRDGAAEKGKPTFIREGIIVSEVDAPRTRGVRALVVALDTPLAGFLRKAENPSHTQWHHARLKDDYKFGYKSDLAFVKRCVHELVALLTATETDEDRVLLADYFSIPAEAEEEDPVKTKRRKPVARAGSSTEASEIVTTRPSPRFSIQRLSGGFSILPGKPGTQPPAGLDVRVAYDVRRGNPLKRYNKADFEIDKKPIRVSPECVGIKVEACGENRLSVSIKNPEFALHVAGFDQRRQLYVKVTSWEDADGSSST